MKKDNLIKILLATLLTILTVLSLGDYNFKKEKTELESEYYQAAFNPIELDDLNNLLDNKKSFILFTYNSWCSFNVPCDQIFKEGSNKLGITIFTLPAEQFMQSKLYKTVKYPPSIIIINKGEITNYLDANSNDDLDYYQDVNKFSEWVREYVVFK